MTTDPFKDFQDAAAKEIEAVWQVQVTRFRDGFRAMPSRQLLDHVATLISKPDLLRLPRKEELPEDGAFVAAELILQAVADVLRERRRYDLMTRLDV